MTEENKMIKELKKELSEIRKYAKENGIKITSCFNRQSSIEASRINNRIFELKTRIQLIGESK